MNKSVSSLWVWVWNLSLSASEFVYVSGVVVNVEVCNHCRCLRVHISICRCLCVSSYKEESDDATESVDLIEVECVYLCVGVCVSLATRRSQTTLQRVMTSLKWSGLRLTMNVKLPRQLRKFWVIALAAREARYWLTLPALVDPEVMQTEFTCHS